MESHSAAYAETGSSRERERPRGSRPEGGSRAPSPDPAVPAVGLAAGSLAGALLGRLLGGGGRGTLVGGTLGGAVGAFLSLGGRPFPTRSRREAGSSARPRGTSEPLESWTKTRLYERAKELGIPGRSKMTKGELVRALRRHPTVSAG